MSKHCSTQHIKMWLLLVDQVVVRVRPQTLDMELQPGTHMHVVGFNSFDLFPSSVCSISNRSATHRQQQYHATVPRNMAD